MAITRSLVRGAAVSTAAAIGLLALEYWAPMLPNRGIARVLRNAVADARGREGEFLRWSRASADDEWLVHGVDKPEAGQTPGSIFWGAKKPRLVDPYSRGGFLLYEPKPGLDLVDPEEGPIVTNSHGLFDRECPVEKPTGTRRVAWLGGSASQGYRLSTGKRFDTLLEEWLNTEADGGDRRHLEVLNFGVPRYRLTQMFDVAMEKAPAFKPDVYIVSLSQLHVSSPWCFHLAELVRDGIDPKYDFLRETLRAAGVRKGDEREVMAAKLAHYRLPILREILMRLKAHAESNAAELIILLIPAAEDTESIARRYWGVRELVAKTGVPVVDLLDSFDNVAHIDTVRLGRLDIRPNGMGHRLIFENFCRKLRQKPEAWATLTGKAAEPRASKAGLVEKTTESRKYRITSQNSSLAEPAGHRGVSTRPPTAALEAKLHWSSHQWLQHLRLYGR